MELNPPLDYLTPEEWREVAASSAPYVATRVGPVSTAIARVFVAMEPQPAVLRYTNGDWALLRYEDEDVFRLGAILPEPDGATMWRVDPKRDVTATAEDLRTLATLILDTLDGKIQPDRYTDPSRAKEGLTDGR